MGSSTIQIWLYRFLFLSFAFIMQNYLTACGGCKKKSSGGGGGSSTEVPTDDSGDTDDTPDPTDDGTGDDGEQPEVKDPSLGEEVPPINQDAPTVIDTSKSAALKHLIFETTGTLDAGKRLLSEYLVVIRAQEPSCVRFKIRPTDGIVDEVPDPVIADDLEGSGPCEGQSIVVENTDETADGGEDGTDNADGAEDGTDAQIDGGEGIGLRLTDGGSADEDKEKKELEWIRPGAGLRDYARASATRDFRLADATVPECSARLFRVESRTEPSEGLPQGLEKVVTKTGRLAVKGQKVRVWIDEEFANFCVSVDNPATGLDDRVGVAFGPLIQNLAGGLPIYDKLWYAQVQNLAAEMDSIATQLTTTYGNVSDIDESGFVEIFISPEINRVQLNRHWTSAADHFRARMIFKPQDLAYYDVESNPASNEGEILYLWTPDPAGIFNYVQFPSGNSISSNYAKGFLTSQLMTLAIANEKIFKQGNAEMEERWLTEALAGLASAYYAGNDFTVDPLAQYLTSWSQYIPLTKGLDEAFFNPLYLGNAADEQLGMRVMFGWYLHTKLCGGTSVEPCAKIKDVMTAQSYGKATIEALLGDKFNAVLENFGLTVGISMLEEPEAALAFWDNPVEGLPPKPEPLPILTEVFPDSPRITEEADLYDLLVALSTGDKTDRTVAGPIPSKKALIFQTITADQDLEFKLDEGAVAYILVTSLVEPTTDAVAFFGKGLNVVFVPIGERNQEKRLVAVEKLSENAHSDFRPLNLTNTAGPDNTTYRYEPYFRAANHSVTKSRELWVLGSIDNLNVNVDGAAFQGPDSDAYNIAFEPCAGLAGTDLTDCEAVDHDVLVQVYVRDFEKELEPMLIATSPKRSLFRGALASGRLLVDTKTELDNCDSPGEFPWCMLCESDTNTDATTFTYLADPTNEFLATSHGLAEDTLIRFSSDKGALPAGLVYSEPYKVKVIDADSFSVTTVNDVPVTLGQHGTHYFRNTATTVTISSANPAIVTYAAHGIADGTAVFFTTDGQLPSGMSEFEPFYVTNSTVNTFELARQPGGAGITTFVDPTSVFTYYTADSTTCGNGGIKGANVYDDTLTQVDPGLYPHIYDNYLSMWTGPYDIDDDLPDHEWLGGYPFTTAGRHPIPEKTCNGFRCYNVREFYRQFFNFQIKKETIPQSYIFFPTNDRIFDFLDLESVNFVSDTDAGFLAELKRQIDDPACGAFPTGFIDSCKAFEANLGDVACENICSSGTFLENRVLSWVASTNPVLLCNYGIFCDDELLLTMPGRVTQTWIDLDDYIYGSYLNSSPQDNMYTWYLLNETSEKTDYCTGAQGGATGDPQHDCTALISPIYNTIIDVRQHFYTPANKLTGGCRNLDIDVDFEVCIDSMSFPLELEPKDPHFYAFSKDAQPTDRLRMYPMKIADRAGEVIGKPQRVQYLQFQVPGLGSTVGNIIIGGRNKSQGKYMLRARFKEAN